MTQTSESIVEQLLPAEHAPTAAKECREQLELDRREVHHDTVLAQLAASDVHFVLTEPVEVRRGDIYGSAETCDASPWLLLR